VDFLVISVPKVRSNIPSIVTCRYIYIAALQHNPQFTLPLIHTLVSCSDITMTALVEEKVAVDEKVQPFASLDGRRTSIASGEQVITSLADADEALTFLENHPRAAEIAQEGNAILDDERQRKRLIRKIDFTIAPLLAIVYFLQYLDKTTLSYTAVMGLRTDAKLHGQQYSDLGMLFYVGESSVLHICRLPNGG